MILNPALSERLLPIIGISQRHPQVKDFGGEDLFLLEIRRRHSDGTLVFLLLLLTISASGLLV
jgi:hypothetical protein